MDGLIGRILTDIEERKDEMKMTGQISFRLVAEYDDAELTSKQTYPKMSSLSRGVCRGFKLSQFITTRQPIQSTVVRCMSEGSRLHSTDIAFKPAESGWGGGGKYANNFDSIFKKNKKEDSTNTEEVAKKTRDGQSDQ